MSAEQVELIDEEGELTPNFAIALTKTFLRFSAEAKSVYAEKKFKNVDEFIKAREKDESLSKLIITEDELDTFTKTVNEGKAMSKEEKDEVREYFDVDKDGNLTLTGFLEMYHLQSGGEVDETWKDLRALGFDNQLKEKEEKS